MSLRKTAITGFIWTIAHQFSTFGLNILVTIILTRLLLPAEFGILGMLSIFISVGATLVNSGLTNSLIRTESPDQADYSTVFYFNLGMSVIMYFIIFFSAPFIADFYDQNLLIDLVRVYSLSFIINALSAIQLTRLTKAMNFKKQMITGVPSSIGGSIVGVALAYMGYGVWSLVWMTLVKATLNSLQLWLVSGWSPSLVFDVKKFKEHLGFGYKLTLSSLINTVYDNIYNVIIGKYYSASQLGFFVRADQLKQLPVTVVSTALSRVTYPLFSAIQNDDVRLKKVYKMIMQMVIFLIAPLLIFMAALAEPMFRFLFTDAWLPAVPYFQILCFTGILYPIHSYNLNILNVKGRSDLFLRLELIKKVFVTVVIIVSFQFGIMGLVWGQLFLSVGAFFINTHYSGKFIAYSSWMQVKDILPLLVLAMLSGGLVVLLDNTILNEMTDVIRLLIGGFAGVLTYLLLNYLLKTPTLDDYINLIRKK